MLAFNDQLVVLAYRDTLLGTAALYGLISFYLCLVYMYFIILLDVYLGCELDSWNAACYYGKWSIAGNYNRSSLMLYIVWFITLIAYSHYLMYQHKLRNWYRVPCLPSEATHLSVQNPPTQDEMHVFNPSAIVQLYRRLVGSCEPKDPRSTWDTIEVKTQDGVSYIDYRCSRYVLKEGEFTKAEGMLDGTAIGQLAARTKGVSVPRAKVLLQLVGPNSIPFNVDSWGTSITKEFCRFFYL